ncbi:aldehyde dehydrogenase [Oceanobacillus piezotolerans]|uniref:Aldehyde dehydrogenase n=1 Tax=Oceanobacillus piezotolerans TaxID=2448030 RepID=A0A498DM65_9BACI|nr:aldehyde dehydrogenase [Oceanobacillus piezotolerans]RLL48140.1 aldehyde dehydrogenase [Oceanobacillus piezotolerans]
MERIKQIVEDAHTYFRHGNTMTYEFRKKQLEKLKDMLKKNESKFYRALRLDLNKSKHEALMTEIGFLYTEIDFAIKNLRHWMTPEKVTAPMTHKGTKNYIMKEPYGVALIISPWNYPLQLAVAPAIGAIAAGNCVILKPSEHAKATSSLLAELIKTTFDSSYFAVIEGEKEVSLALLKEKVDYIFFTGSTKVGKEVMKAASEHLTPVTLELGGKSPAIVDEDANINLAAKRIAWGKFTNAGQTCVAPDYVFVHDKVKFKFLKSMKRYIRAFYGRNPLRNADYTRIINEPHFDRLSRFLTNGTIIHGGNASRETLMIEPTILDGITFEDPIMQEEIFGPILPVVSFSSLDDALYKIKMGEKPLALYYFGENETIQQQVIEYVSFGGGSINDTFFHLANPHLPFGGVGASGTGAYHGKYSFDTFSHTKSILKQTTKFDLPFRYPGGKVNDKVLKGIMK